MDNNHPFLKVALPIKQYTEKTIDYLSIVLLIGIFVLGLAQVFWRWILNNPITWSEELIQLTYVWICYLGWVLAAKHDSHIRITAVVNALPKLVQKYIQIICHILVIIFSILIVYYGIKLVGVGAKRTAVSFPMSYAVVYVMGPICNAIIIFYELAALVECFIKGPKNYADIGVDEKL